MSSGGSYTYEQAAELLNLPPRWLKDHIKALPHSKYGTFVRFDDDDIAAIRAMHKRAPEKTEAPALALVLEAAFRNHTPRPSRRKAAA